MPESTTTESATTDSTTRMEQALALLEGVCQEARDSFCIPFIGIADPETYGVIVDAIIDSDRSSIARLAVPGENKELTPPYLKSLTNPEDFGEASVLWHAPTRTIEDDIRTIVADGADWIVFHRLTKDVFGAIIRGPKKNLVSIVDWTSEWFISIKMNAYVEYDEPVTTDQ